MTSITLRGVGKSYGTTVAVGSVDLTIESGDLFFLLGPSGCGKTTLLRMIAGFIAPTRGRILLGDRDVTTVPPNRRNTGMVFQSYALWPHLTVFENVAFGLRVRRVAAEERTRRVHQALELVRMREYAARKPNQLSGGQQQRVALARALAIEPTVLLLDEPLSNLDAKLRLEMRGEIRRICSELGITTVYVTHDQKEALSLADDMVILRDGAVMQKGEPRAVYQRPASKFVADFIGETNFLAGVVARTTDEAIDVDTAAGRLRSVDLRRSFAPGSRLTVSLRPESLHRLDYRTHGQIAGQPRDLPADGTTTPTNILLGHRRSSIYFGELAQHVVEVGDGTYLKALEVNPIPFGAPGENVALKVAPDDVVLLHDD